MCFNMLALTRVALANMYKHAGDDVAKESHATVPVRGHLYQLPDKKNTPTFNVIALLRLCKTLLREPKCVIARLRYCVIASIASLSYCVIAPLHNATMSFITTLWHCGSAVSSVQWSMHAGRDQ